LARDRHLTGFPEFEQFCIAGFPASTQVALKSGASADSATPAGIGNQPHHNANSGDLRLASQAAALCTAGDFRFDFQNGLAAVLVFDHVTSRN
jgi:hypothetical protein